MASALPREAAERFLSARRGDLECDAPVCFARRWVLKQPTHESATFGSGFTLRFNLFSRDISNISESKEIILRSPKVGHGFSLARRTARRPPHQGEDIQNVMRPFPSCCGGLPRLRETHPRKSLSPNCNEIHNLKPRQTHFFFFFRSIFFNFGRSAEFTI